MNNNGLDERQQMINTKAVAAGGVFMMVCICVSMIWRLVTTEELGWEFWSLIGCCLVILIARRAMGDVQPPKSILDKPLPTGNSREERRFRKRDYACKSLIFAGTCAVMDVVLVWAGKEDVADLELVKALFPQLDMIWLVVLSAVLAFAVTFGISWVAEYLVGEHTVKRYNKMLAELDEDE